MYRVRIGGGLVLLGLGLLASVILRSDREQAEVPRQDLHIAFLGHESVERDPSFDRFVAAVRRHQPSLAARSRFEFVGAPDDDEQALDAAIRRTVATRPTVLVAPNGASAMAAQRLADGIPVVFSSYLDPVRYGVVDSLNQRQAAITGVWISDHLDGKRIEILHDAYPWVKTIAVFGDRSWGDNVNAATSLQPVATRLGLQVTIVHADNEAEARAVFAQADAVRFDAWCVPRSYLAVLASPLIVEQMRQWKKPVIFASTLDVPAGAPMAYALDTGFVWSSLAELVARVASGEPAGSIPVQRPQRFELALRTGSETGLPPPDIQVVRRADRVYR